MNKYRKWTVIFCLLTSVSVIFGQVAKSSITYAPLAGWLLGTIFIILALYYSTKL